MENPNVLITGFPLVVVPLYAVPLLILLHLAALKRLKLAAGITRPSRQGENPWSAHYTALLSGESLRMTTTVVRMNT